VIVDIVEPGADRQDVVEAFSRHAPGVPIIAIGGLAFRRSGFLLTGGIHISDAARRHRATHVNSPSEPG
jgi:hypothetical protein